MRLRTRLLVFGYPALELITLGLLIRWIGLGWVLFILLACFAIGMVVMRHAGRSAFATMRAATQTGQVPAGVAGRHALEFAAGALIAIPGVWSTLAGIILLLPPGQALVTSRSWFTVQGAGVVDGTVIQGTVIQGTVVEHEDDEGPAGAGPSIERG